MVGGLLVAAALALLALTGLRWMDTDDSGTVAALQSLRWVYGLVSVPVLLAALLARRRWAVAPPALLVAVHLLVAVPAFVPGPAVAAGPDDLVVMSANLEFGQADPDAVVEAVRRHEVDVLVLVEITAAAVRTLTEAGLDELLPEASGRARDDAGGTVVRSHLPLAPRQTRPSTFDQPAVVVQAPGGDVLLRGVHPVPPLAVGAWHAELSELVSWAVGSRETQDLPMVIAGDLNASEDHPVFRRLTEVMTDSHRARGAGWVRTWPLERSFPPAFCQIDHVLVRGLGVVDAGTVVLPGTDHVAVWARLSPG